jgi:hypothetical protein
MTIKGESNYACSDLLFDGNAVIERKGGIIATAWKVAVVLGRMP